MNKYILAFILMPGFLAAQIDLPPASPDASWVHQLGFTQVSLSYSRPQMRDRKIFGELVPYGEIWRTGAGESTRIRFSEDILFAGKNVNKGNYSLYSIPGPDEWTIILNEDATLHGDFGYDEKKDILRVQIKASKSSNTKESFQIEMTDFKPDYSASLRLSWEDTEIFIPIKSNADNKIMAQIQEHLIRNKSDNANLLNKGAQYYFTQNRDLVQALEWSVQSELLSSDIYNYVHLTIRILEKLKRFPEAIQSAEKAIQLSRQKNMNTEADQWEKKIIDWRKM
jgi:hypothetical protein